MGEFVSLNPWGVAKGVGLLVKGIVGSRRKELKDGWSGYSGTGMSVRRFPAMGAALEGMEVIRHPKAQRGKVRRPGSPSGVPR